MDQIVAGNPGLAPTFGGVMYAATVLGLTFDFAYDLWGASKNLLLYVRPTTLRVTANGYAIVTRRSNIQAVLHDFVTRYDELDPGVPGPRRVPDQRSDGDPRHRARPRR